jgi:hypothetical protein
MQAQQTLVKYNNPILVSTTKESRTKGRTGTNKRTQLTPTEDILNSILPPRYIIVMAMQIQHSTLIIIDLFA